MSVIFWLLFLLYLVASAVLILVVLIQSGKGGGLSGLVSAGTTLGDTLGASGVEKTLNRWTSYCAIGFLVINILLVIMGPIIYQKNILDRIPLSADLTAAPATAPEGAASVEGPTAPATTAGEEGPATPAAATGAPAAEPRVELPAPAAGAAAEPAASVPADVPAPAPAPAGN